MMDSLKNSVNASGMKSKIFFSFYSYSISKSGIKQFSKKEKDKRFVKNWSPISLLSTNMKIINKVISAIMKNVLSFLISSN